MASRRPKLQPISVDELYSAPGMSGFVSFLNVKPWEQQTEILDELTGVESPPVILPQAHTITPERMLTTPLSTSQLPVPSFQTSEANPNGIEVTTTTLVESTRVSSSYRQPLVREVRFLQDSLSFGEEALYNALWANAEQLSSDAKVISIGFERMSRLARLTDKNCKINCKSLIGKNVIEILAETDFRAGRTYKVYNFKSALQRQKDAGLTHVIRTRGVQFVDPISGHALTPTAHNRRVATMVQTTPVKSELTRVRSTGLTGVKSANSTPVNSTNSSLLRHPESQPSTAIADLVCVLQDELAIGDGDAARQIIRACRTNAPDATDEDIARCVRSEARRIRLNRRIENPVGLLITQVPKCFQGDWRLHRAELVRGRAVTSMNSQPEDGALQRWREEQEAALNDPNVSEAEKELIRKCL